MNTTTVTITEQPRTERPYMLANVVWLSNTKKRYVTHQDTQSQAMSHWIAHVLEDANQHQASSAETIKQVAEDRLRELSLMLRQIDGSLFELPVNSVPVMSYWMYQLYQEQMQKSYPLSSHELEPHLFTMEMTEWMIQFIQKTGILLQILDTNPGRNLLQLLDKAPQKAQEETLQQLDSFAMDRHQKMESANQIDQLRQREKETEKRMKMKLIALSDRLLTLEEQYEEKEALRNKEVSEFVHMTNEELQRKEARIASQDRIIDTMTQTTTQSHTILKEAVIEMSNAHQRVDQARQQEIAAVQQASAQKEQVLMAQMTDVKNRCHAEMQAQDREHRRDVDQLQRENRDNQRELERAERRTNQLGSSVWKLQQENAALLQQTQYLESRVSALQYEVENSDDSSCLVM